MRTTVPAAKDALRSLLAAALPDALVQLHLPTTVPKQNQRAYIAGTENLVRTPATQQGGMREQYELVLLLESREIGADPQPASDGLWMLVDAVDALLLADHELDGAVDDAWLSQIAAENTLPLAGNKGWLSRAEIRITMAAIV